MNPFLGAYLPEAKTWHADALCRKVGHPDDWFPSRRSNEDNDPAAICLACPVIKACAQFALDNDETHGVWGGVHIHPHVPQEVRRQQLREVAEA